MSELTIKHAGSTITSPNGADKQKGAVIRVSPTLQAGTYDADGAVLFNPTAIPNAVATRGGCSLLRSMWIMDYEASTDADLIFVLHEKNAADFGTVNATANISVANLQSSKLLGQILMDETHNRWQGTIDNARMHQASAQSATTSTGVQINPLMMLKADSNSTDVYVTGLVYAHGTGFDWDTGEIELVFHIEYL